MRHPVDNYTTKWYDAHPFGTKTDYGYHEGGDLNLKTGGNTDEGQPIYAIADGICTSVHTHSNSNNFGKHLHLQIDGPWGRVWGHYAHCSDILVAEGQSVREGQLIARVGRTGTVYSHLHFAIKLEPTGIDGIAKTKEDLKKWTDPLAFIQKWIGTPTPEPGQPMPDTIQLDKKTFEALVTKATLLDSFTAIGVKSVTDIEDLKRMAKESQDERNTALEESKNTREAFSNYKQRVAEKLQSPQDLERVIAAIDDTLRKLEQATTNGQNDASENQKYEAQIVELQAELTRITTLIKSSNPLQHATTKELLVEFLRRVTSILKSS